MKENFHGIFSTNIIRFAHHAARDMTAEYIVCEITHKDSHVKEEKENK